MEHRLPGAYEASARRFPPYTQEKTMNGQKHHDVEKDPLFFTLWTSVGKWREGFDTHAHRKGWDRVDPSIHCQLHMRDTSTYKPENFLVLQVSNFS
jgi:hypothetical protein